MLCFWTVEAMYGESHSKIKYQWRSKQSSQVSPHSFDFVRLQHVYINFEQKLESSLENHYIDPGLAAVNTNLNFTVPSCHT